MDQILGSWWGYLMPGVFFAGWACRSLLDARARRREVAKSWLEFGGGVYHLSPADAESQADADFRATLFAAGEGMRRDEFRSWLGRGDFDAELNRAAIRNANKAVPLSTIHGRG